MRIIQAQALSSFDDYKIEEVPIPEPGPGEVLVRVAFCSIGYADALVSLGRYQVKPPLPHTPGGEVAGVVEKLGPGAPAELLGARVITMISGGGFREYGLAAADAVERVPERLSLEQAAVYRVNFATALHGLRDRGRLAAGERLLVTGAAGGVGLAAVQLGRMMGAEVIAAASTEEKRAFALANGAHHAIDTEPEGWRDRLKAVTGGKGVDVVYDPVCGPLFELAFRSLAWGGRHLVVGFVGGMPSLPVNLPLLKGADLVGVDIRQFGLFEPEKAAANNRELADWLADGRLAPTPGPRYPFAQYKEALAFAMSGKSMGKALMSMD
ncbi:MAG: NADPH:quinone oxidoreductase family protein [Caulobacteraceae bacterium]|nr:NADPH:quinone oxidoreductase family protein [Caulobacteraceae bacterium]